MSDSRIRLRVSELLEPYRPKDTASHVVDIFLILLIMANVVAISLDSVDSLSENYRAWFHGFEIFSVIVFTLEYLLRLWSCVDLPPSKPGDPPMTRWRWARSPLGIVDLLAILPFYIYLLIPDQAISLLMLRMIRMFQLVRLFKLTRYSPAISVLSTVMRREAPVLAVVLFILVTVLMLASWGMYMIERNAQPDAFGSIPGALWWAVVSLTTVGYGDVVPITVGGRMFAGLISLIGIGMISLPAGILASGFSTEMHRRNTEYQSAVNEALSNGWLSPQEEAQLEVLRNDLGLDDDEARTALIKARINKKKHLHCPHCGEPL